MKQKKLSTDFNIPKFLAFTFLAFASLFWLNGCTITALELAEEKASPENCEYWKMNRVISAIKQENGNISVCIELNDPGETKVPQSNTITLPHLILIGDTKAMERFRLRPGVCPFDGLSCYWYPIEKAKTGCESFAAGSLSSTLVLPVEKISVNNKDRNRLYDLLNDANKNQQVTDKIYQVSFVSDKEDLKKEMDPDETIDTGKTGSENITLTHWPVREDRRGFQPIIIAGAYEDNSTNLYYLLIPLAFVGDVVVATVAVMAYAIISCPYCFANY